MLFSERSRRPFAQCHHRTSTLWVHDPCLLIGWSVSASKIVRTISVGGIKLVVRLFSADLFGKEVSHAFLNHFPSPFPHST